MTELGTKTLLFADIQPAIKHWVPQPVQEDRLRTRLRSMVDEAVAPHGGVIAVRQQWRFMHLALIDQTDAAVRLAAELAERCSREPIFINSGVRLKVALNRGEVWERDGVYYGPTVMAGARLRLAANGGQILLSQVVAGEIAAVLPSQYHLRAMGAYDTTSRNQPEPVFELISETRPTDVQPLRRLLPANNLVAQPNPLIGRDWELAATQAALLDGDGRLLTLTGAGGTGKTRLSLELADALMEEFPDGVFIVSLATLRDATLLPVAIAQTLGSKALMGQQSMDALYGYLRERRILLVLDNLEQLLAGANLINSLLEKAPQLRIIATSRERLKLAREREFFVSPLGVPEVAELANPQAIVRSGAVQLFVERARALQPAFSLTEENASTVARLCSHLDGLPLAIELAAARVRLLSPAMMLKRLEERLSWLTGGGRGRPVRQQTLRATIEWSHDLLTNLEKQLFRQLAVFHGGCVVEMARQSCLVDGAEQVDMGLVSLLDKNLLYRVEDRFAAGEERFAMLETIREYAREQLANAPCQEVERVRERHARAYLALAEEADGAWRSARQHLWNARIEAEHDNFRAAMQWSLEVPGERAEVGARLAAALYPFWQGQGNQEEGDRWLAEIHKQLDRLPPPVRTRSLNAAASLAFHLSHHERALALWTRGLELSREIGDDRAVAQALRGMADLAQFHDKAYSRATALYEESLKLFRKVGDMGSVARCLNEISGMMLDQGQKEEGLRLLEESLALDRVIGNLSGVAYSLGALALDALDAGNGELAARLSEEGLVIRRQLGDRWGTAAALDDLARASMLLGDYAIARWHFRESLAGSWEQRDSQSVACRLEGLAWAEAALGDVERAACFAGAAEQLRASLGIPLRYIYATHVEKCTELLRRHSDHELINAAWERGRALTLEAAVACGLSGASPLHTCPVSEAAVPDTRFEV